MGATAPDHAVRRSVDDLGITNFTPHDLRRTAASYMTSIGISGLVVRKLLNHLERGVTAVYDRHSCDADKRDALTKWDRKLREIIAGKELKAASNVISLEAVG